MPVAAEMRGSISVFVVTGQFNGDELKECIGQWYPEHPSRLVVYDFSTASLSSFDASSFVDFAKFGARFSSLRGEKSKTAVVVSPQGPGHFAMKAYLAMTKSVIPINRKLFTDYDEAVKWLEA